MTTRTATAVATDPGNYRIRVELEGFATNAGTVKVRPRGAEEGRVLLIELALADIESGRCGNVRLVSWKQAREIQREARESRWREPE